MINQYILKISQFIGVIMFLLTPTLYVQAAVNFTVSPLFINFDAEPRDIFTKDITLTNHAGAQTRVYASVHEVKVEEGAEGTEILDFVPASMGDRSTSITSWIEITRARLEIPAEGNLVVPLKIKVNPTAPPGIYHAMIGFASGKNTDEIDKKIKTGQSSGVIVTINIADKKTEGLHLVNFITNRFVYQPENNEVRFTLENTGDYPVTPKGEVIIYDTSGKELGSIIANSKNETLKPGEKKEIVESLPYTNRLGKNKAYLNLEYGNNKATLFDTAFYYSVPWYYLAGLFALFLLLLLTVALVFRRAVGTTNANDNDVYDLPLFVKERHGHEAYDHDIDLKNDKNSL